MVRRGTRWAVGEEESEVGGGWEEVLPRRERTGSPSSLVEVGGGREDWIGKIGRAHV